MSLGRAPDVRSLLNKAHGPRPRAAAGEPSAPQHASSQEFDPQQSVRLLAQVAGGKKGEDHDVPPVQRVSVRRIVTSPRVRTLQSITMTVALNQPSELKLSAVDRHFVITVYRAPGGQGEVELTIQTMAGGIDIKEQTPRRKLKPRTVQPCGKRVGKKFITGRWNGAEFQKGVACDVAFTSAWRRATRREYHITTDGMAKVLFLTLRPATKR
jgi:hypothetical protein